MVPSSQIFQIAKHSQGSPVTMKFAFGLIATVLAATTLQAQALTSTQPGLPSYVTGPSWFPTVLKPYQQGLVRTPTMENSPRLHDLIRTGKLRLTMSDD